jgi:flavin-dependent dehydrogenase
LDAKLAPGYLAWIADDGEEIHIGVGGYPSKFEPNAALTEFRDKIAANFVDCKLLHLTETRGGRIPVGGVLRHIANEHGLLIGDAAGAVSPLTAGGLDPCLRLSAVAANVITERLRKSDPKLMLNYSGRLFRTRFISRLWMRRMISVASNQTAIEAGFALFRTVVGKRFARHVFFGRGSFPDVEIKIRNKGRQALVEEN